MDVSREAFGARSWAARSIAGFIATALDSRTLHVTHDIVSVKVVRIHLFIHDVCVGSLSVRQARGYLLLFWPRPASSDISIDNEVYADTVNSGCRGRAIVLALTT